MTYEYTHFQVPTKGWFDARLPEQYLAELNRLAKQGWQVDQVVGLQRGMGETTAVVFLMKRATS
ncbi:MAG: DUF4177 domain-containing protein [Anaerolineales bacterium]|nr:DUF4177 domain-containing protein [Anaerolineales bacterium]